MSEQDRICTIVRRLRIPRRPDLSIRLLEDKEAWFSDNDLEVEEDLEANTEDEEINEYDESEEDMLGYCSYCDEEE